MTDTAAQTLEAFGAAFLRLHALVHSDEVKEMSAKPGFTVTSREETGRRASGSVSDPTVTIVLDDRRAEVSEAASHGERALTAALHNLKVAAARLERARDRWAG